MNALGTKQVLLTYPVAERELADQVAASLEEAGLKVWSSQDIMPGASWEDHLRELIKESMAVVVVLSQVSERHGIPQSILFEIGAAYGADKPVHVFLGRRDARLPFNLQGLRVHPISDAQQVGRDLAA